MFVWSLIFSGASAEVDRPRGVSISKAGFYVASGGLFTCLDGSRRIPYEQVLGLKYDSQNFNFKAYFKYKLYL